MATLPGGPADKIPNNFESLWLTNLLLDVLSGAALSVRLEPAQYEAECVECLCSRPNETVEAHQCKMHNGSAGKWSAADLESHRLISAAQNFLSKDSGHRFVFVSGDTAPGIRDLHDRAIRFDRPVEFWYESATNKTLRQARIKITSTLGLQKALDKFPPAGAGDEKQRDEIRPTTEWLAACDTLMDFLRRFRPEVVDERRIEAQVSDRASTLVFSDPDGLVRELQNVARTRYRETIDQVKLIQIIQDKGFTLSDLTLDQSLGSKLNTHNEYFRKAVAPLLIDGQRLDRPQTNQVMEVSDRQDCRLVLLHGDGGSGKTGILYEFTEKLAEQGRPYLAVSMTDESFLHRIENQTADNRHLVNPVAALQAIACGQTAWLILDQLDALRWTSQHDPRALEYIRRVIRQIGQTDNLRLVTACRSFDLRDDQRLAALFEFPNSKQIDHDRVVERIEVSPLSNNEIQKVLSRHGHTLAALTDRQKVLLSNPQHLWVLTRLYEQGQTPDYTTAADLNGTFWRWFRDEQLNPELRSAFADDFIPALFRANEDGASTQIPATLYNQQSTLCGCMLSSGILIETSQPGASGRRSFRFAHQSHHDYLIGEQMAADLYDAKDSIADWCLAHDDLFRRNQLRHYMELLAADGGDRITDDIASILEHRGVRFHLKKIALQTLELIDAPTLRQRRLYLGFIEDATLRPHLLAMASARGVWAQVLHNEGLFAEWANSTDDRRRRDACTILHSRLHENPGFLFEVIGSVAPDKADQCRDEIYNFIAVHKIASPPVHRDYISWLEQRPDTHLYPCWKELREACPRRAVDLIQVLLDRRLPAYLKEDSRTRSTGDFGHILKKMSEETDSIAKRFPLHVLSICKLSLEHLHAARAVFTDPQRQYQISDYRDRQKITRSQLAVERLALHGAKRLARRRPSVLWDLIRAEIKSGRRQRMRLASQALVFLPRSYRNRVLGLYVRYPRLFDVGPRNRELSHDGSRTRTTRRVLKRFAPTGSEIVFQKLVREIRQYVPSWERKYYQTSHKIRMDRLGFRNGQTLAYLRARSIFVTQYALLDALPAKRLDSETLDWLGVLRRRFGAVEGVVTKRRGIGMAHIVHAPIGQDTASRMSDRAWLKLVAAPDTSVTRGHRYPYDGTESSPEHFAGLLREATRREPQRFIALALQFPLDCYSGYFINVLNGMNSSYGTPANACESPAIRNQDIEPLIRRLVPLLDDDREIARSVCGLIQSRYKESWSDFVLDLLERLAQEHADPVPGHAINIDPNDPKQEHEPDHVMTAINCVRGSAIGAIEALRWEEHVDDERYLRVLKGAIADPHAAVRVAGLDLLVPLLNQDRPAAVEACVHLCEHPEDGVFAAHGLNQIIPFTVLEYHERVYPLVQRMTVSSREGVAEAGVRWAIQTHLYRDEALDSLRKEFAERTNLRRAAASTLADVEAKHLANPAMRDWISDCFTDQDDSVRHAAADILHREELYENRDFIGAVDCYVRESPSLENLFMLTSALSKTSARLSPYRSVLSHLMQRLMQESVAGARSGYHLDQDLPGILLRLYEESDSDSKASGQALDLIDQMIEQDVRSQLLPQID